MKQRIGVSPRALFKMPKAVRIMGRRTSLTNAFVNGILPCVVPSDAEILEAIRILGLRRTDLRCAYCNDKFNEWDHLRPIVRDGRPTGYITEIANLVPCCSPCNQSKSGTDWDEWITGPAKKSPKTRGVRGLARPSSPG